MYRKAFTAVGAVAGYSAASYLAQVGGYNEIALTIAGVAGATAIALIMVEWVTA